MFKAVYIGNRDQYQRKIIVFLLGVNRKIKSLCSKVLSFLYYRDHKVNKGKEQICSNEGDNTCLAKKLHILLVEDNKLIALVHGNMLSQLNCEVDIASNGLEALAMAAPHYNLIILDIGLPDIIGIELAKTFKQRFQEQCPPMVAITAMSTNQLIKNSKAYGIKKVFEKPVDLAVFRTIISDDKLLEKSIDPYSIE